MKAKRKVLTSAQASFSADTSKGMSRNHGTSMTVSHAYCNMDLSLWALLQRFTLLLKVQE